MSQEVVKTVAREFSHASVAVALVDDENQLMLVAEAGQYGARDSRPVMYLEGQGLITYCARMNQIVYEPDVSRNPHYYACDPRTRSELVVPLTTLSGVIGVMDLQSMTPDAFSPPDRRIIAAFAERVATLIENIRLFEKVSRHASELEARVQEHTTAPKPSARA